MSLPYARATISARDATALRTSASCLYLKKVMQTHAIMI